MEIQEVTENKNGWMDEGIGNIYKFPNNNLIKIRFHQAAAAKKTTEKGILAFCMSIPPNSIKPDEFTEINICMRWYK